MRHLLLLSIERRDFIQDTLKTPRNQLRAIFEKRSNLHSFNCRFITDNGRNPNGRRVQSTLRPSLATIFRRSKQNKKRRLEFNRPRTHTHTHSSEIGNDFIRDFYWRAWFNFKWLEWFHSGVICAREYVNVRVRNSSLLSNLGSFQSVSDGPADHFCVDNIWRIKIRKLHLTLSQSVSDNLLALFVPWQWINRGNQLYLLTADGIINQFSQKNRKNNGNVKKKRQQLKHRRFRDSLRPPN